MSRKDNFWDIMGSEFFPAPPTEWRNSNALVSLNHAEQENFECAGRFYSCKRLQLSWVMFHKSIFKRKK